MNKLAVGFIALACLLAQSVPMAQAQGTEEAVQHVDKFLKDVGSEQVRMNFGLNDLIGNVLGQIIGVLGTIALAIFLYSGIMWMMSEGDAGKLKKAKRTMIWASIGLAAIFLSYFGVVAIIEQFGRPLFGG